MHSFSPQLRRASSDIDTDLITPRLTKHADRRAQQRAISKACIPILRAFGRRRHDGRGAVTYLMTSDAMDLLIRAVGRTPAVERLQGVYMVEDILTNSIITIGHSW